MYDKDQERPTFGCPHITEDDVERIAESAATRAIQKMKDEFYKEVGKSFLGKLFILTGMVLVGIAGWLHSKGFL